MVEVDGEFNAIITREDIAREEEKLARLKEIVAEKRRLIGQTSDKEEKAAFRQESREASAEAKKQSKLVSNMKKEIRELEKKQREQDKKLKDFFSDAGRFVTDPLGAAQDAVSEFLQSSRAVPILGAATGFALAVFKIMEREFGDGGQFDLRVRVHDAVRSIVGLKNLMDIDGGVIFMSPDTRITNMPPETSNTESLRDGHVRYNQLTLGYT